MNELRAAFHEWHDGRINCLLPVRVDNHPMKALYAALVHVDLSDMGAASEAELADAVRLAVPRTDTATDTNAAPPVDTAPDMPEEDAETLYQRGNAYIHGKHGVKQDYVKARKYYERAAEQGYTRALIDLGYLYGAGRGVQQDYAKARDYFNQAAEQGDKHALYNLGLYYEYGRGVAVDYAKALAYYEQAAAAGYQAATAKIEELREKLNPVPNTPEEDAETLYQRGMAYYFGRNGVDQNYDKARQYLERAAEKGHADALYYLGIFYEHGWGVKVNYTQAREYWEKAAEKGHVEALFNLGRFYDKTAYAKARKYYEQAAEKGHVEALYNLGWFYEHGWGCSLDRSKALEYFKKAADAGHKDARTHVDRLRKKLKR